HAFSPFPTRRSSDLEHQALGAINLAYHSGPLDDDEARLALVEEGASLLRSTGLDSAVMRDLAQTRWQKLVWNVPYNGLSVLLDRSEEHTSELQSREN